MYCTGVDVSRCPSLPTEREAFIGRAWCRSYGYHKDYAEAASFIDAAVGASDARGRRERDVCAAVPTDAAGAAGAAGCTFVAGRR